MEKLKHRENDLKDQTYFLAFIAAVLTVAALSVAGVFYIWKTGQTSLPLAKTEATVSSEIVSKTRPGRRIENKIEVAPVQGKPQPDTLSDDTGSNIAAMRVRQAQRDAQIQAYRQTVSLPMQLPDLPEIEPLQMPVNLNISGQTARDYYADEAYTLPQDVMTRFTSETGLSQIEVEQAMNQ